jgi:hypothetical protein
VRENRTHGSMRRREATPDQSAQPRSPRDASRRPYKAATSDFLCPEEQFAAKLTGESVSCRLGLRPAGVENMSLKAAQVREFLPRTADHLGVRARARCGSPPWSQSARYWLTQDVKPRLAPCRLLSVLLDVASSACSASDACESYLARTAS